MTKKHFIALANAINLQRLTFAKFPSTGSGDIPFTEEQIECLASFCASQSSRFNRDRWLDYIKGENGQSGGKVR